jgi:hypothetical protein
MEVKYLELQIPAEGKIDMATAAIKKWLPQTSAKFLLFNLSLDVKQIRATSSLINICLEEIVLSPNSLTFPRQNPEYTYVNPPCPLGQLQIYTFNFCLLFLFFILKLKTLLYVDCT